MYEFLVCVAQKIYTFIQSEKIIFCYNLTSWKKNIYMYVYVMRKVERLGKPMVCPSRTWDPSLA